MPSDTFKTPAISSLLRIVGSLALAWVPVVLAIVLLNDVDHRSASDLLLALPGLSVAFISFVLAKIIDCLALIAHNTTAPRSSS